MPQDSTQIEKTSASDLFTQLASAFLSGNSNDIPLAPVVANKGEELFVDKLVGTLFGEGATWALETSKTSGFTIQMLEPLQLLVPELISQTRTFAQKNKRMSTLVWIINTIEAHIQKSSIAPDKGKEEEGTKKPISVIESLEGKPKKQLTKKLNSLEKTYEFDPTILMSFIELIGEEFSEKKALVKSAEAETDTNSELTRQNITGTEIKIKATILAFAHFLVDPNKEHQGAFVTAINNKAGEEKGIITFKDLETHYLQAVTLGKIVQTLIDLCNLSKDTVTENDPKIAGYTSNWIFSLLPQTARDALMDTLDQSGMLPPEVTSVLASKILPTLKNWTMSLDTDSKDKPIMAFVTTQLITLMNQMTLAPQRSTDQEANSALTYPTHKAPSRENSFIDKTVSFVGDNVEKVAGKEAGEVAKTLAENALANILEPKPSTASSSEQPNRETSIANLVGDFVTETAGEDAGDFTRTFVQNLADEVEAANNAATPPAEGENVEAEAEIAEKVAKGCFRACFGALASRKSNSKGGRTA